MISGFVLVLIICCCGLTITVGCLHAELQNRRKHEELQNFKASFHMEQLEGKEDGVPASPRLSYKAQQRLKEQAQNEKDIKVDGSPSKQDDLFEIALDEEEEEEEDGEEYVKVGTGGMKNRNEAVKA